MNSFLENSDNSRQRKLQTLNAPQPITDNIQYGGGQLRDVVIMAAAKDLGTIELMVPYCRRNIACRDIYIVANKKIEEDIKKISGVTFYDEAEVIEGLNLDAIGDIIEDITGTRQRAGWYLQQFLKLGWSYICHDDDYITVDADTVPLNRIDFTTPDGRYLFTRKTEYNKAYFDTMERLFNSKLCRNADFSFIAEHMIFNCSCVREMLNEIMSNTDISGDTFYEKIMRAVSKKDILKSGFSEFETYGNYMSRFHPDMVEIRELRTLRGAVKVIGIHPSQKQLRWASDSYDLISLEQWTQKSGISAALTRADIARKIIPMHLYVKLGRGICSAKRKIIN